MPKPTTEAEKILAGHAIAEFLNLKPLRQHTPMQYNTAWGTKTALGLYESIDRIIQENNSDAYSLKG
jgi:hypothetical protein